MNKKGFTLIELLVVISIIALLSSIVLSSLNDARAKARDSVRRSDLRQIKTALELYKSDKGDFIVKNAGGVTCGRLYSGGWSPSDLTPMFGGWFNFYADTSPARDSIDKCLFDGKYLGGIISDPSNAPYNIGTPYNDRGSAYMIALSSDGSDKYTIWANLEKPSTSDLTTLSNCSLSSFDNYTSGWPANRKMNYCVSN